MWEDPQCAPGGKWSIRYTPKSHTNKFWEDLALALIGDMFKDDNEVLGILLNLKPSSDQIQVWHRSGKDQGKVDALKADLEGILNLEEHKLKLDYENFADALSKYAQPKAAEGEKKEAKNDVGGFERAGAGFQRSNF